MITPVFQRERPRARSEVGLSRLPVTEEIAGSNPVGPAKHKHFIWSAFLFAHACIYNSIDYDLNMQLVNRGLGGPRLGDDVLIEALRHNTPQEMIDSGTEVVESGILRIVGGVGLLLTGGSLAVLSREKPSRVFNTGRLLWSAGLALSLNGVHRWNEGAFVEQAGEQVKSALAFGEARIVNSK